MIVVAGHLRDNPRARGIGIVLRDDEIATLKKKGTVAIRVEELLRAIKALGCSAEEMTGLMICAGQPGENDDASVADFISHFPLVLDHAADARPVWP